MIQKSFGQRKLQIKKLNQLTRLRKPAVARPVEVDLFDLCRSCACSSSKKQWEEAQSCCPVCGFHTRISSLKRIPYLLDDDYESISPPAAFVDPLDFPGYEKKWQEAAENSGVDEAVSFYWGSMEGSPLILGVMDPFFMMGSMGSIVGERIVAAFDLAAKKDLPVVIVACSGGARMQEGIVSLMQMRRTAAAVSRHRQAGRLFISVLTDPTTGGVTASFASLGDIILAEPGALIGFAGPRVIKETIQCDLPQGFQSAEFQEKHGFVDRIVERTELRAEIARLLRLHDKATSGAETERTSSEGADMADGSATLEHAEVTASALTETSEKLNPFDRVRLARDPQRKKPREILEEMCTDIVELKGDRSYADDPALRGGLARLGIVPITYLYIEKGDNLNSQIYHNFGMPQAEGYRKAARLMRQAEQFGRPILTLIDTPGAYPGVGAEERGQGEAIASNLALMAELKVPFITVITGEAGSGGALGLACADRLYMLENAVYTILSPEGFATILWKDSNRAEEAASVMKLTAADMLDFGVCQRVFPDSLDGLKEQILHDLSDPELKL